MRRAAAIVAFAVAGYVLLDVVPRIGSRRMPGEGVPAVRVQIEVLGTALSEFRRAVGRYPTTEEGLRALRHRPDGLATWQGPYLTKDVPDDPWGRPFVYRSTGGDYEVSSLGADGKPGGSGIAADTVGTRVGLADEDQSAMAR